ncbi:MAG: hypothetical protein GX660_21420 [Clostridiaceae bacterium]|nr:hypothetical protein [Clostridiaceae bacterium]
MNDVEGEIIIVVSDSGMLFSALATDEPDLAYLWSAVGGHYHACNKG